MLGITDGRAHPLMDRQVVGVVFFWSGCNGCSGHLTTIAVCSAELLQLVWLQAQFQLQPWCGVISVV